MNTSQKTYTRAGTFGLPAFLAAGALAFSAASLSAQSFNFTEDFTGSDGSFPTGWYDSSASDPPDFTPGVGSVRINNNTLQMRRPSGTLNTGTPRNAAFNGSADGVDSANWTDYTAEVLWSESRQDSSSHTTGILARWQGTGDPFSGYFAYEDGGILRIGKDFTTNDNTSAGTVLASTSLTGGAPANDETTRLEFDLQGDTLTAEMFENDGSGNFTVSMGSVTATDSDYSQGSAGLRAYLADDPRSVTFDDFSVTGVPEPQTYALLFGALSLGFVMLRRRRS